MGGADGTINAEGATALSSPTRRARLRASLGYALAAACLVWVLHDFDVRDLLRRVAAMNLWLVAAAVLCDVLSYVCQGWRWRMLLRPFGSLSVGRATQAVYAGLFANEVMPMKPGELVRAYVVSRWMFVRLGTVAVSILIERLFDAVWLAAGSLLVIIFLPLPRRVVEAGDVFVFTILILFALFLFTALRGDDVPGELTSAGENGSGESGRADTDGAGSEGNSLKRRLSRSLAALTARLGTELRAIGRTCNPLSALALSLAMVLLQALSFWLVMRAYGLRLSLPAGAAVFLVVHLGTVVPGAPANVGTYQFFTVLGLSLFGVEKGTAAGFSLVVFALLTAPLWAIGFWALGRSGLTLFDVLRKNFLTASQK